MGSKFKVNVYFLYIKVILRNVNKIWSCLLGFFIVEVLNYYCFVCLNMEKVNENMVYCNKVLFFYWQILLCYGFLKYYCNVNGYLCCKDFF